MPTRKSPPEQVFLNIPYDEAFRRQYLAYIAGICSFGLTPRATLDIPTGVRRLDRIFERIKECEYSIHDLSRVQLNHIPPRGPRFNMPFELGLTLAWHQLASPKHVWFVFERQRFRLEKTLSDLSGTDPLIHGGTPKGILRELCNAFVRHNRQPTVPEMCKVYHQLRMKIPNIVAQTGANSIFSASVFKGAILFAKIAADEVVGAGR